MMTSSEVKRQLKHLGFTRNFLCRAELDELPRILLPDEQINQLAFGWYNAGMALLCATNHRVLLIDKKPFSLVVEDVRYDMIAEVMYQYRLLDASIFLTYAPKTLQFKCWNQAKLRQLASYIQQRVVEKKQKQEPEQPSATETVNMPIYGGVMPFVANQLSAARKYSLNDADNTVRLNPYRSQALPRRRKLSKFVTTSQIAG